MLLEMEYSIVLCQCAKEAILGGFVVDDGLFVEHGKIDIGWKLGAGQQGRVATSWR